MTATSTPRTPSPDNGQATQPATLEIVGRLADAGVFTPAAARAAQRLLRPDFPTWRFWIDRALVALGAILVLAGIIFFFAFNWDALHPFAKLGLIEAALLGCVGLAAWKGLDQIPGKAFLTAASVLVGVFLAVFGQIYQTGADAYELFQGWALLITCWVLIAEAGALWFVWCVLLMFWLSSYGDQVGIPGGHWSFSGMTLRLGLLVVAFGVAREAAAFHRLSAAPGRWFRFLAYTGSIAILSFFPFNLILGFGHERFSPTELEFPGTLFFALWAGLSAWWFRFRRPDLACLTTLGLSLSILAMIFCFRLMEDSHALKEAFGLFFLAFLGIIIFSAAAWFLRWTSKEMEKEFPADSEEWS